MGIRSFLHLRAWVASAAILLAPATAPAVTVELNLLYVHGVNNCASSRQNAHNNLDELQAAVDASLAARIAAFQAAHPGVAVVTDSAHANLYTAEASGFHPSDSVDPLNMDDWEVGDPGCTTSRQGEPCTSAFEWRYRLAREIERLFPEPARNIVLVGHSTGARVAMEVASNTGPDGVGTYDWGVQDRIAGVVTVHGMIDAIGTSKYNVAGVTSFETACKDGDALVGFGDSCAPGNGWCEYASDVNGSDAADWVAQSRRALMLTAWGSCSPSAWTGRSDGSLPYDAQASPMAVGLDMTPAAGETWRVAHGQHFGSFCHSAITHASNSQHVAARDAARQRILDWLFVAAPRVAATGTNTTSGSIAHNQFSATFTMGSTCPAGSVDDNVTSGTEGLGLDVVGVCRHPGFFDGDDHAVAAAEISTTNGSTCNGTYRWQQAHDSDNNHAASFWWKTRSLYAEGPDLVSHLVAVALGDCGNGQLDQGEECDDGNEAGGDCCSSTCELDAAGTACAADGNACTNDVCTAGGVCGVPNTASCNDGLFCNGADTCSGGSCSVHSGSPCSGGVQCNDQCNEAADNCLAPSGSACAGDGNPCTSDVCNGSGVCGVANSASCNDGVFCNGSDTCSGGSCSVHAGNPCSGGAQCNDQCNEAGDTCFTSLGTTCSSDGNPCTNDVCNGAGSCGVANGAPCNDGVFCNGADTCAAGSCSLHAGNPCSGGAACNDQCNEVADNCAVAAGAACPADGNPCTNDVCNGSGTCGVANGAACNDGLFCNGADTCAAGSCSLHAGNPCSGGGQCNDQCNEAGDSCRAPAGTPCAGDGDPCTTDVCDAAGSCGVATSTSACDDGNLCTTGDHCVDGTCTGQAPLACGICETCDPDVGCVARPRMDCKATGPGNAELRIRNSTLDERDSVYWSWRRGAATDLLDLGPADVDNDYELCVFEQSQGEPSLLFSIATPGDVLCSGRSCWRFGTRSLKYKNAELTPQGLRTLVVRTGSFGKASLRLQAAGALLSQRQGGLAELPLPLPLTVQLGSILGGCWEAGYSSAEFNNHTGFEGTSD
ncbi:MAG TPA: hypothetical protein VEL28_00615 [Candidatus Binatia bacterium]|nr:hypothetical protein [Candidatus Binatia bacterium]